MFEARLENGSIWKKIIEAIKDVVEDADWDCSSTEISLQGIDSSHVALVSLCLKAEGFDRYRCDRNLSLGLSSATLAKILKCANNDDAITIRACEGQDTASFIFESSNQEKVSTYDINLMEIDNERLGIPNVEYDCVVKMPSAEFQRICRDLSQLGDSVAITCTKEGIRFETSGSIGTGKIAIRPNVTADNETDVTSIEVKEPVILTFALRYLNFFTKATPLSHFVILSFKAGEPLVCEYKVETFGHIKYYIAPKIEDDETNAPPPTASRTTNSNAATAPASP